ncbi:hypothetical protein [uncultured Chryseobacterium sp.]|nr:hypothetical protein [uncultured Chryseobacterium sp.]
MHRSFVYAIIDGITRYHRYEILNVGEFKRVIPISTYRANFLSAENPS